MPSCKLDCRSVLPILTPARAGQCGIDQIAGSYTATQCRCWVASDIQQCSKHAPFATDKYEKKKDRLTAVSLLWGTCKWSTALPLTLPAQVTQRIRSSWQKRLVTIYSLEDRVGRSERQHEHHHPRRRHRLFGASHCRLRDRLHCPLAAIFWCHLITAQSTSRVVANLVILRIAVVRPLYWVKVRKYS